MEVQLGSLLQAPGGQGKGVVRFVGNAKFREGIWVGLELEAPTGKNNGEVQGVRYFSCRENHGLFVRLQDIPKENILAQPSIEQSTPATEHEIPTSNIDNLTLIEPVSQLSTSDSNTPFEHDLSLSPISSKRLNKEARIEELEEMLEMVSLDKEIAEARIEELEQQLAQVIQSEEKYRAIANVSNINISQQKYNELLAQNNELRVALEKLRDMSVIEREGHKNTKEELDELKQEAEAMKQLLEDQMHQIDDMEQSVDDASVAQQVVDQLTEKCLCLEGEIIELKSTIDESTVLQELSEEVESHHVDVERILQSQIEEMETSATVQERKIVTLQERLKDIMHTVEQFRSLVQAQREKLKEHEQKESELEDQTVILMSESRVLMDKNLQLQAQTHKMRVSTIESELMKLEFLHAQEHLHHLLSIVPSSFLSFYSSPFFFVQLLKRIECKCALIQTTLRREAGVNAGDACVNAGDVWIHTGYACVQRMEFTAKFALFFLDHCANDAYVRAAQCVHEVVCAERALDACISVLSHRDYEITLELFEAQCASDLLGGISRMEVALADLFQDEITKDGKEKKQSSHLAEIVEIHSQVMLLYHLTTHALSVYTDQDASSDLSTMQGVWAKIYKSMEMGNNGKTILEKIQKLCATGKRMFTRLLRDGLGTLSEEMVREMYKQATTIVDENSYNIPPLQENGKKCAERIRVALLEASGVRKELEEVLDKHKEIQGALTASQVAVSETKRQVRQKNEEIALNAKLAEDLRSKDHTNYAMRVIALEEQIESLQKMVEVRTGETRKYVTKIQYLEGKVRELMEISGKQKKLLVQLQQGQDISLLPDFPSPRASEVDSSEAVRYLQQKCAKLKAELVAATIPHLTNPSEVPHFSDPIEALSYFSRIPPLPDRNPPPSADTQLAHAMNEWLRNSTQELANVHVVDLTQKCKLQKRERNEQHATQGNIAAQERIASQLRNGLRLRERACDVLTPGHFCNLSSFGHFVPPHIAKMITENKLVHLGTITLPHQSSFQTYSTIVSFDQWRNIHSTFCDF